MNLQTISIENLKTIITNFVLSNPKIQALGNTRISFYFIGSLAHGGFSEFCSDIDIACIFDDTVKSDDISAIVSEFQTIHLPISKDRLSVFWSTRAAMNAIHGKVGRFPELDKLDLIAYGDLFFGEDCRSSFPKPSHKDILIDSCQFALERLYHSKEIFEKILNPEQMINDIRLLTKLVLFPARFIYTAKIFDVAVNDRSVQYFIENQKYDIGSIKLLQSAIQWRMSGKIEDVEAALKLISTELIPLYKIYIQIYKKRMQEFDAYDLISQLDDWESALG